jgi:hypothetical protein
MIATPVELYCGKTLTLDEILRAHSVARRLRNT